MSTKLAALASALVLTTPALAQSGISPEHMYCWGENIGYMNWYSAGSPQGSQGVTLHQSFLSGFIWCENIGWVNVGDGAPANGSAYANLTGADFGVNISAGDQLSGLAWGENIGWINLAGGAAATPPRPARIDYAQGRLRGYAWGENVGWINLDDALVYVGLGSACGSADFDCDGDVGTDADIERFFACLAGACPAAPCRSSADFDGDGDVGTDADIEAFFRVLAGGSC